MAKVIVGMSGGVDSGTAAYLLKEAGYEVIGMTLQTNPQGGQAREIEDARRIAEKLQIPYFAPNVADLFDERVKQPFFDAYIHGRTPNPCTECNRVLKWDRLLHYAAELGADFVATGHYASVVRLPNGRFTVRQADFAEKDQTYMLYRLSQEQLEHTLMPLGKYSKPEVRRIAEQAGLDVAQKRDSQEICFVTDGNYADYILRDPKRSVPGEGNFVSEDGKILGKHRGIIHYTVGQRKGLIAAGYPIYVRQIRPETNEVVLGDEKSLYCQEIRCDRLNFMSIPGLAPEDTLRARVKIRFHHAGEEAAIMRDSDDSLRILFDAPVRAATPGQSAVFYDEENRIIGGGIIMN